MNGCLTQNMPQQPSPALLEGTPRVTESQLCYFSVAWQQAHKVMCCLSLSWILWSHKSSQYLKESTQNYQWGLRVKTVSWNLNQHFLQKKHSTWICNVLKIQLQEAVGSRLCRYLFSFVTQPTAAETEPSSLTSLTQLTSYYVCMNLLLIIIYSHDAVINCL